MMDIDGCSMIFCIAMLVHEANMSPGLTFRDPQISPQGSWLRNQKWILTQKMTLRKKQTKHHFKATHGISWIWFICDFQPLSWIHGRLSAPLCRSHPAEKTTPQDVSEPKDTRFKWLQRSDKPPFFEGWKPLLVVEPQKRRNSLMNHPWDAKEGKWGGSWKWDWNTQKKNRLIEGSLEVKLPTIWTDEKQTRAEAERSEKIRKEKSRRERLRRKKMQMREKVGKPRNSVFFQWFEAPEGPVFHDLDYCGGNRHCCTRRRRRERTTPLKLKGAPESLECIG